MTICFVKSQHFKHFHYADREQHWKMQTMISSINLPMGLRPCNETRCDPGSQTLHHSGNVLVPCTMLFSFCFLHAARKVFHSWGRFCLEQCGTVIDKDWILYILLLVRGYESHDIEDSSESILWGGGKKFTSTRLILFFKHQFKVTIRMERWQLHPSEFGKRCVCLCVMHNMFDPWYPMHK